LYGTLIFAVTGSASISARQATTPPGLDPFSTATIPCFPTPVLTSSNSRARSFAAITRAVRSSRFDNSGCWWKSRRWAMTVSRNPSAAVETR
jgi:hypothetical protein